MMPAVMNALSDLLPLYALGVLDRDDAALVEQALATNPALRSELVEVLEVGADLITSLAPVDPDPSVRARLLAAIAGDAGAATDLVARVAALFDLAASRARAVLAWVDEPRRWIALAPGVDGAGLTPGPAQAGATCGLLRLAAGATFPWHAHLGEEVALVVSGGARMSDGRQVRSGDEVLADASLEHDIVADDDGPCVFAVRSAGLRFATRPL